MHAPTFLTTRFFFARLRSCGLLFLFLGLWVPVHGQSWNEVLKSVPLDRANGDQYGIVVDISGNYAVVGSVGADTRAGAAYLLERNAMGNWSEIKRLVATDRADSDEFGRAVAIEGDYIVVGAPVEDEDAEGNNTINSAGSAYIFARNEGGPNNWGQLGKIVAADRVANDVFGQSVDILGDVLVVGASGKDSNTGAAYVFAKDEGGINNWGQVRKIVSLDRADQDYFGRSVAIAGDQIMVAAYFHDKDATGGNTLNNAGAAYIFTKDEGGANQWGQTKKLVANDRGQGDFFGASLSVSGDYLIVEASGGSAFSFNGFNGMAYVFARNQGGANNWGQVKKLLAPDGRNFDNFGYAVSISGNYAIVGAYEQDSDASGNNFLTDTGAAYLFAKDQGGVDNWGQIQKIAASDRVFQDIFGVSVAISGNYAIVGKPTLSNAGSAYIFETVPLPEITLAVMPATILEDSGTEIVFTFMASTPPANDLVINFSVSGTSIFNEDYVYVRGANNFSATSGTITIPAGQTSASLVLQATADPIAEPDETIILTVVNP